ncbi:MAG: MBL fold metallo-hydrolase [Chloroflexi bacterium]|nr:MBL fold metallo-hydrolase [Chloroflexota bacterium]
MSPLIKTFVLGSLQNNSYWVGDPQTRQAVIIDPAAGSPKILEQMASLGCRVSAIWLTHAHFDHIAGVSDLLEAIQPEPAVWLHPDDLDLWRNSGGAGLFGYRFYSGPEPDNALYHGQVLKVGQYAFEVRHTPGHTPGHVTFYNPEAAVAFCGDLIFHRSVGRTDLPGGNMAALLNSIRQSIFSLPPETRLLSGHGPETTVAEERAENPFLNENQ